MSDVAAFDGAAVVVVARPQRCAAEAWDARRGARRRRNIEAAADEIEEAHDVCSLGKGGLLFRPVHVHVWEQAMSVMRGFVPSCVVCLV